jgi:chitodextrinase
VSAQSSSAAATTLPGADLVPPSTPTNLQGVAVSGTRVDLTWGASTDTGGSGLAGYQVFRDSTHIGTSSMASYSDTAASVATTYSYNVRAYDGAPTPNYSGFSNTISVTTPDTLAPSAPGNPTFSAITGGTATATWTAANDNVAVTGYRYSLNGGSSWTNVGNVLSTNLTGLSLATQYTMLVQAGDAASNWGPSSSGTFATGNSYTDNLAMVGGVYSNNNPIITGYGGGGRRLSDSQHRVGRQDDREFLQLLQLCLRLRQLLVRRLWRVSDRGRIQRKPRCHLVAVGFGAGWRIYGVECRLQLPLQHAVLVALADVGGSVRLVHADDRSSVDRTSERGVTT